MAISTFAGEDDSNEISIIKCDSPSHGAESSSKAGFEDNAGGIEAKEEDTRADWSKVMGPYRTVVS